MANSVTHFAIYADELDRAMDFYRQVFGWRFEAGGPPDFYKIYTGDPTDPGITAGALSRRQAPVEGRGIIAYRCTISVESIDDTVGEIEKYGGTLNSDIVELPGIGRLVEVVDTEGNVVCAMQYEAPDPRSGS